MRRSPSNTPRIADYVHSQLDYIIWHLTALARRPQSNTSRMAFDVHAQSPRFYNLASPGITWHLTALVRRPQSNTSRMAAHCKLPESRKSSCEQCGPRCSEGVCQILIGSRIHACRLLLEGLVRHGVQPGELGTRQGTEQPGKPRESTHRLRRFPSLAWCVIFARSGNHLPTLQSLAS